MNPKTTYRIGAADDCDIVIKQPTVSKYHCELRWTQQGWQLHDLNSTNGSFVDGKRVTEPCGVTSAQSITLGRDVPLKLPASPITKPVATTASAPFSIPSKPTSMAARKATKRPSVALVACAGGVVAVLLLLVSMICLNQQSEVVGMCVKDVPVQSVGDPQRCQISNIEVFWK